MSKTKKLYFNWSSGKDAALALHTLQNSGEFQIDKLVTTVNSHYDRVSMHGLRIEMLKQQSLELGIPLELIKLPENPDMQAYDTIMDQAVRKLKSEGYNHCGFGDIFLEDLRKHREDKLKPLGISCSFPLWKKDTRALIHEFIKSGFKAVVICINAEKLDESFVGRDIDESFIADLPDDVDPCGENGEFHTFCYDGPVFKNPIRFTRGEKVYRAYERPAEDDKGQTDTELGFWFMDLVPGT